MMALLVLFFSLLQVGQNVRFNNDDTSFLSYKQTLGSNILDEDDNQPQQVKLGLFYYHQWCNFVAWGILVDVGIIANRYGILLKNRVEMHGLIMGIVVIPSILAELFIIIDGNTPELYGPDEGELSNVHSPIGFTFLGIMCIQTLGGAALRYFLQSKDPQLYLKYMSLFHFYFGYIIYLLGKVQLGLGFYICYTNQPGEGQGDLLAFWIIYAAIFFWRSIFELLFYNGKLLPWFFSQKEQKREKTETLQDSLLIQYIEQNEQSQINVEFQHKQWFIFNNEIIDLTGFFHPGGQFIWEKSKGREVSRFIYGGAGLENGSVKQYQHSQNAILMLKHHVIGSLNNLQYLIPINEDTNNQWKLNTITKINDKISYFGFTNQTYKITSQFVNLNSFGKYFQIKSLVNLKLPIRQYTCISCMSPDNIIYREQLIKYAENVIKTNQQQQIPIQSKYVQQLPLLIKCYDDTVNGFSKYIHQHQDELYEIQGPFGPPHGIPNKGKVVIICGGTGIFPFLDLLDFLLKTLINDIITQKLGIQIAESQNIFNCQYNNNIHITLFFAAANKDELIGQDIYFNIIRLQKLINKEYLKIILKIKDKIEGIETTDQRFNEGLFKKYLGNYQDYARFLICGPPPMQATVPQMLKNLGVEDHFIHFV